MKVLGFNAVHDPDLNCSRKVTIDLLTINEISNGTGKMKEMIFSYLSNGLTLFKYVSPIYDTDGEYIGPNIIYTDGIWVWPSYYLFYLKKYPSTKIAIAFIEQIKLHNGICPPISKVEQNYIEYLLVKMLRIKVNVNPQVMSNIQLLLNDKGEDIECY